MVWSFINYASYQTIDGSVALWLLRLVIFLGVWHSFTFFHFLYVFPLEKKRLSLWYKFALIPYVALVSLLTLSPYVFSGIDSHFRAKPPMDTALAAARGGKVKRTIDKTPLEDAINNEDSEKGRLASAKPAPNKSAPTEDAMEKLLAAKKNSQEKSCVAAC